MPPRLSFDRSPHEETIRHLKSELYEARRTVIGLMPDGFQKLVDEFHSCASRSDLGKWRQNLVADAVRRARLLPESPVYQEKRAYCPLCGGGRSMFDAPFKVPGGLHMHLEGSGNTRQCSVMKVIWEHAWDQMQEAVLQNEQMKEQREWAAKDARRAAETLWRVDPDEPKLSNEGFPLSLGLQEVRDEEAFGFAEERLTRLGFKLSIEGNVRAWTQEIDDLIVYADPRARGRIDFNVYSKMKKPKRLFGSSHSSFHLQDSWRNDLLGKYKTRLEDAISQIRRAGG